MQSSRSAIRQAARAIVQVPAAGPSRCRHARAFSSSRPASWNPFNNITNFLTTPTKSKKPRPSARATEEQQQIAGPEGSATRDVANLEESGRDRSTAVTKHEEPGVPETSGNLFDQISADLPTSRKRWSEHKYSTANFKISPRKLNKLANQISGRPIDDAILQMQFSEKRAGKGRIKSTLALARQHAVAKGLNPARLVVAESWVSKGQFIKRIDIKGRARHGIKEHPQARLHVKLREGHTKLELQEKKMRKTLRLVRSAGVVREDQKIINHPTNAWKW